MADTITRYDDLAALFAQAPSFMAYGSGPDHVLQFANAAFTKLVGNRDLLGKSVREAFPELEGQGFFELLKAVYVEGRPYLAHSKKALIEKVRGAGLTEIYVDFAYQPIFAEDGSIAGILAQGTDVTDRVVAQVDADAARLHSALRSRQSGMDSMSATLAHELNQPLTIIANTVRAVRRFLADPTPEHITIAQDALIDVEDAALRVGELIRRLRDTVSRAHVRNHPENLRNIAKDAVQLAEAELRSHNVSCMIDVARDIVVSGDRIQLQQVLVNLINNAIEAIGDASVRMITVDAHVKGRFARLCVTDTGTGFDTVGDAERIFELMFTTKEKGLGLGLSICRAIIEAHGGTIWLGPTDPAKDGAAFCFTIPLYDSTRSGRTSGQ